MATKAHADAKDSTSVRRSGTGEGSGSSSALAYKGFRNFFVGSIAANSAQQVLTVATGWLIYDITNDNVVYLGYAGLAISLPGLFLSLFGGAIADRVDLRKLLVVTQVFQGLLAAILMVLAFTGAVAAWHVLVISFFVGAAQAFNNPARQVMVPELVDRVALPSAVALNALAWHGTRVIAPAIGGLSIAFAGISTTFFLCTLGFLVFAVVANTFRRAPRAPTTTNVLSEIGEGLGYIWRYRILATLIGLNFCLSFFGMSVFQIFPVFAKDVLDVGADGLGLMYSAVGVGSVAGLILATKLANYERRGLVILLGAIAYGVTLTLFSLSPSYPVALVALFFVGGSSQVCMNALQTALQLRAPDRLRGRIMGTYTMTFNMGPLGSMEAGLVAATFGAAVAVEVGAAVIIVVAGLLLLTNPMLRQLRNEPERVESPA